MTTRSAAAQAAAVSRKLRALGFRPLPSETPRSRQGLRVSGAFSKVRVFADFDSDREAHDMAVAARQALIGAGYTVEVPNADYPAFLVSKS